MAAYLHEHQFTAAVPYEAGYQWYVGAEFWPLKYPTPVAAGSYPKVNVNRNTDPQYHPHTGYEVTFGTPSALNAMEVGADLDVGTYTFKWYCTNPLVSVENTAERNLVFTHVYLYSASDSDQNFEDEGTETIYEWWAPTDNAVSSGGGGSVSLNGSNGSSSSLLPLVVVNGGDVTLTPLLISNPTYLVHYTVTPGAIPVTPASIGSCCGYLNYVTPDTGLGSSIRDVVISVPYATTYCINFLVTDSAGAAQYGGSNDYVQYVINRF